MVLKKTKKFFDLINGGVSLKDKFALFIYLFNQPKGVFRSTNVSNKLGKFHLPKTYQGFEATDTAKPNGLGDWFRVGKGFMIDIGANIGKYSIQLANRKGENTVIIALEPEKRNFEVLRKNIELNNLEKKIIPYQLAIANKNGEATFYVSKQAHGSHSMKDKVGKKINIPCMKLDSFLEKKEIQDVRLIKIDVQGAEIEVLEGAKKTIKEQKPNFIIEIETEKNLKEIKKRLKGYKEEKISNNDYWFYHQPKFKDN